jgi:hypothetical protein
MHMQLIKDFPHGHKYFRDENGCLHIADQSGDTPLDTEDGDLIVDLDRKVSVQTSADGYAFVIPLKTPGGEQLVTLANLEETDWLTDECDLRLDQEACDLFPRLKLDEI